MDREQDNEGDVVEELRGKHAGRAQAVVLAPIISRTKIRSMQERVARTGSVMPFSTPRERESSSPRETATP